MTHTPDPETPEQPHDDAELQALNDAVTAGIPGAGGTFDPPAELTPDAARELMAKALAAAGTMLLGRPVSAEDVVERSDELIELARARSAGIVYRSGLPACGVCGTPTTRLDPEDLGFVVAQPCAHLIVNERRRG